MFARIALASCLAAFFVSPALAQYPPVVESVPANSHAALPPGTKATCTPNPNTGAQAPNCPVLKLNGYTYWALSYQDNRVGMAIAVYDPNNRFVMLWERPGSRYVWKIEVDNDKQTVAFHGQSDAVIRMAWQDIAVAPGSVAVQKVTAQQINCLFAASCGAVTSTDTSANIAGMPNTTGTATLQTRTFIGAAGTPAAGKTAYQYRVDLSQAVSNAEVPCVTDVSIDLGPTLQFNYDGTGTPGDAYFVVQTGVGTIGVYSATRSGNKVDFVFDQPVCAGPTSGSGKSTMFFGVTSASAPKSVTANVGWPGTLGLQTPARAPAF